MSISGDLSIDSALAIQQAAQQQQINVAIAQTERASQKKTDSAVLALLSQAVQVAQIISDQQVNVVA